jgi:hypothetical protein
MEVFIEEMHDFNSLMSSIDAGYELAAPSAIFSEAVKPE